jgi:hypothetical protein
LSPAAGRLKQHLFDLTRRKLFRDHWFTFPS